MIKITTHPADNPLFGQSKWWGQPDMPEELEYPELTLVDDDGEEYQDPLTFVCQLRCEELAALDLEGMLPHEGMLWFFAALDYFLGDMDTPAYPGMGSWLQKYFRVFYSPTCDDLHTHSIVYDDGTPVGLPAESIIFSPCDESWATLISKRSGKRCPAGCHCCRSMRTTDGTLSSMTAGRSTTSSPPTTFATGGGIRLTAISSLSDIN